MRNETLRRYCFTNKNIDTPKIPISVKYIRKLPSVMNSKITSSRERGLSIFKFNNHMLACSL